MAVVSAAEEAPPEKRGRKGEERSKDASKRVPHESFTKGWHVYILWTRENGRSVDFKNFTCTEEISSSNQRR